VYARDSNCVTRPSEGIWHRVKGINYFQTGVRIMSKMTYRKFQSRKAELMRDCTAEQIRFLRIACAKELEDRIAKEEKKFFKTPAIGS
jgi:hypothetical protein